MDAGETFGTLLTLGIPDHDIKRAMIEACDTGKPQSLGMVTLWPARHGTYTDARWEIRS